MIGTVEVRLSKREEKVRPEIMDLMTEYLQKCREIEKYHDIGKDGFLKSSKKKTLLARVENDKKPNSTMMMGSTSHQKMITRANYKGNDFMTTFGAHDRSAPETSLNTGATMKQILKMMSSEQCKDVVSDKSQLMLNLDKFTSFSDKIKYLYHSIYGRSPEKKELTIASNYLSDNKSSAWQSYIMALLNSPEFYFIK
jgi:hypothetical protein